MSSVKTIEHCHKLAEQKGGKCLSTKYVNSRTKYLWECEEAHQWWSRFNDIQQDHWCIVCTWSDKKKTIKDAQQLALSKRGRCLSEIYENSYTKLLWECEKGHQWLAIYKNIQQEKWCPHFECIGEKIKQTFLQNYGVGHPFKNKEIRLKAAKSANKTRPVIYWETGETLYLEGWEDFVAEHWNKNKIRYISQPKTFDLGDLKTYTPDFYLPDQNIWVEVKGRWFDEQSKNKWFKFNELYPNSQLWNEHKLKELGISIRR